MKFVFSRADAFTNARIKYYFRSDGSVYPRSLTVFPEPTFRKDGFEPINDEIAKKPKKRDKTEENLPQTDENRRKSFNRAKNALFDLLMCNGNLGYFVTLTFDRACIVRDDYCVIIKKLSRLLDNWTRRKGLSYILVPEFHQDGAIHFHGVLNAECLNLVRAVSPYSGKPLQTKSGKPIYNISAFKLGFTTAIPIGEAENERQAVAKYVYKYITKSGGVKVGGRYYLSGGALRRPKYELLDKDYFTVDVPAISAEWGEFKRIVYPDEP